MSHQNLQRTSPAPTAGLPHHRPCHTKFGYKGGLSCTIFTCMVLSFGYTPPPYPLPCQGEVRSAATTHGL